MDHQLIDYYDQELKFLRESGQEFARVHPKMAQRLLLDPAYCGDPYVERLLEGVAFLAARVRHKLESDFPRFTQGLLNTVFPHYLMPTPSMAMVRFLPDLTESALAQGWRIPRGTVLRSIPGKGDTTTVQFSSAHDVVLWPLELTEAGYHMLGVDPRSRGIAPFAAQTDKAKSALSMRFRVGAGLAASALHLDRLTMHLCETGDETAMRLYEALFARCCGVLVEYGPASSRQRSVLSPSCIHPLGFEAEQALLPGDRRVFEGYRLIREYFAFPQRFMFVDLVGLREALAPCDGSEFDITFLFSDTDVHLERNVTAENLALNCTPAINMFSRRLDRIQLSNRFSEFHVVADRTRPTDFEVLHIREVTGHSADLASRQSFRPFYAASDLDGAADGGSAYFTANRVQRTPTARERRGDLRSSYLGSEVYLSLVDRAAAPYRTDLSELAVTALCSNRDLPSLMTLGAGQTDFTLDVNAPLLSIRCLGRPTSPVASHVEKPSDWRAISHLSLNYLSLVNSGEGQGAAALREMLSLYAAPGRPEHMKQIEGLASIRSGPVVRRLHGDGPIAFVRGLELTVSLDENAFRGSGVFLIGVVLERFLSQYVSVNSFTETVLRSPDRGEIMRWLPRNGMRPLL